MNMKLYTYKVKTLLIVLLLVATFTELNSCHGQEIVPATKLVN